MCKTAYIFNKVEDSTSAWIQAFGCDNVVTEKAANERSRPKLRQLVRDIKSGDTLIISKLSNATRGVHEASVLLEICRLKGVRLISIEDMLDTEDVIFQLSSAQSLINIMGKLPMEVNELRRQVEIAKPKSISQPEGNVKENKLKRNVRVINMYLAGHSLRGICSQMKICRTSVYNILKRNGISKRYNISGE